MKQIILGTAGHIDHGKTSLVRAVTGIDTDRLKEEKERGITIELGFADLVLPSGRHLAIVDVPGHEKFVKNMVAGASGIDMAAMIIAADEGIMPQTREHMEICSLLGIKHGLAVLTKTDMVDEEWLELVKEEVAAFLKGTFLENKPIVCVSSSTGHGIPEFIKTLDALIDTVPERSQSSLFRLPVDRVFTMKGFGTVITGSLISGKIKTGETIMVYPSKITSKIRGIQVHSESVEEAVAGMRTAVNFQGLDKAVINRGDVLARPGSLKTSFMVDVYFSYLNSNKKSLKNRTRVRFHAGTSEILGNLILLNQDEIAPGESSVAQIRLDLPVTLVKDDRFVIRSYSPVRTIGGGQIINPVPEKHKRFKADIIKGLTQIIVDSPENIVSYQVMASGAKGASFTDLILMSNQPEKKLGKIMEMLLSGKAVILADRENQIYIHSDVFEKIKNGINKCLNDFHQNFPLKPGMSKEELKSKFSEIQGAKIFNQAIDRMAKDNIIELADDIVRLSGHTVLLGTEQVKIKEKIKKAYLEGGLTPPYFRDIAKTFDMKDDKVKDVLMVLVEEEILIKTKDDLYFDKEAVNDLKNKLVGFLEANEEISTSQFKDLTGASRKYVIPLIEYFDSQKVTIRVGDMRRLRKG